MRTISVDVTADTFEALEVERSLIGFESRSAYLRWIITNRAGIDQGTQPDWLVDAYHRRMSEDAAADADPADATRGFDPELGGTESRVANTDGGTAIDSASGGGTDRPHGDGVGSATPNEGSDGDPDGTSRDGMEVRGTVGKTTIQRGDGPARSADDDAAESRPDSTVREADIGTEAGRRDGRPHEQTTLDTDVASVDSKNSSNRVGSAVDAIDSVHLTPERIERIREDAIETDAGVLGSVEVERVDELSRRAVAKTRERLNRDVQTGLEYASATDLADDVVRPGEDVADLDELSVPGRSAEVVATRRELAGSAVAFLRDENRARKSDFVDALYETHSAGYDTTDGWWRCVKAALKQVDVVDGGAGARVWRYDG